MSRKPMDSALPHFVLAWGWRFRKPCLATTPGWCFRAFGAKTGDFLGESLWETHNRQTRLTWGQAPWDLPSHWKPYMSSLARSTSCLLYVKHHTTAESGKWSDTNFPVLTGANRPGFGSTRFKICIHYSISTDLVQKQLKKSLRYSLWGADPDNLVGGFTNPSEKICSSNWIISIRIGMNIKKLVEYPPTSNVLKPPMRETIFQRTWNPIINMKQIEVLWPYSLLVAQYKSTNLMMETTWIIFYHSIWRVSYCSCLQTIKPIFRNLYESVQFFCVYTHTSTNNINNIW